MFHILHRQSWGLPHHSSSFCPFHPPPSDTGSFPSGFKMTKIQGLSQTIHPLLHYLHQLRQIMEPSALVHAMVQGRLVAEESTWHPHVPCPLLVMSQTEHRTEGEASCCPSRDAEEPGIIPELLPKSL